MSYAIMLGSNMFVGTNGVMSVEGKNGFKEFFRVREIFRARSEGSYLAVDCDIKDTEGEREVKLFKSNPVVVNENVNIEGDKRYVVATRSNGSTIIKVEQVDPRDPSLPNNGPVRNIIDSGKIDAILRITGTFVVGDYLLEISNSSMSINTNVLMGNLNMGTGGLRLGERGFDF